MSGHRRGDKSAKRRRKESVEKMRTRRAASAMATVEDLARALGIGRNKAYEKVRDGTVRAMRIDHRWLIPRTEIAKLTGTDAAAVTAATHARG